MSATARWVAEHGHQKLGRIVRPSHALAADLTEFCSAYRFAIHQQRRPYWMTDRPRFGRCAL